MDTTDAALHAVIDANLRWLGITPDPAWRASIAQNLAAISGAIQAIEGLALPDEAEPAPTFTP